MADTSLTLNILANDQASSVLRSILGQAGAANKAFGGAGRGASKAFGGAGRAVSGFNNQLRNAQGQFMPSAADQMMNVGRTLTNSVTRPLVNAGKSVFSTGMQFQRSMNRVGALTGAVGEPFQKLDSLAQDLGSSTAFSASQAADAMGFLAMAGFKTNDILQTTPGVLSLAAAGQVDLGRAADISSNILSGYSQQLSEIGPKSEQLAHVNDILANTFTQSNTDLSMMGSSFKFVGPVADAAGMAFSQTAAAIGVLGDAGRQGSQAGTDLRRILLGLQAPSGTASKAFSRLGLSMKDFTGEAGNIDLHKAMGSLKEAGATTQDLKAIFGTSGITGAQVLMNSLERLGELTTSNDALEAGKAAKIADKQLRGLSGETVKFKSALEGLKIAIFKSGIDQLGAVVVHGATRMLQGLSRLPKPVLAFGTAVAAAAAAVGPLLVGMGAMVKLVGLAKAGFAGFKLASGLGALGPVFSAMGGAVAAIGVGPLIGIAGGIALVGGLAYKFWPAVKSFFAGIGQGFSDAVAEVGGFKSLFAPLLNAFAPLRSALSNIFPEGFFGQSQAGIATMREFGHVVGQTLAGVIQVGSTVGGVLVSAFIGVGQALGTFSGMIFQVGTYFGNMVAAGSATFMQLKASVVSSLSGIGAMINIFRASAGVGFAHLRASVSGLGIAFNMLRAAAGAAFAHLRASMAGVGIMFNILRAAAGATFAQLRASVMSALSGIGIMFNMMVVTARANFMLLKASVVSAFQGLGMQISAAIAGISTSIGAIGTAIGSVVTSIGAKLGQIPNIIRNAISQATAAVRGATGAFRSAGAALMRALAAGIQSAAGAAVQAVSGAVSQIRGLLPFSPAKYGPLSDLDKVGPAFVRTIAGGIAPGPLVSAVSSALAPLASARPAPAPISAGAVARAQHQPQSGGATFNFSPTYNVNTSGGGDLRSLLEEHSQELIEVLERWWRDKKADELRLRY